MKAFSLVRGLMGLCVFAGGSVVLNGLRSGEDRLPDRAITEVTAERQFSQKERTHPEVLGTAVEEQKESRVPEAVTGDIFLVYDGMTVVLPDSTVERFYRPECPYTGACASAVPCVNVVAVRTYLENEGKQLLERELRTAVAKNENGQYVYRVGDTAPDIETLVDYVVTELSGRADYYRRRVCDGDGSAGSGIVLPESSTISVLVREVPGTDGSYAPNYLEIDDSQQHLYVWQDGRVDADYEVSGFYDNYAVYGVFAIGEKARNAFSDIAKKWMPFWMAYYYDTRQNAWLGIHELVYWTDENGVYHEESADSIGHKKSGGCIRLDRGKAEELYDRTAVGTPVLIHP